MTLIISLKGDILESIYRNMMTSAKLPLQHILEKRGKSLARLRVREVAEAKGVSMGLLSRKSNVTLAAIRKVWRDPHHDISFKTLEKIAAALEVPVSSLIENGDASPPEQ